MFELGGQQGQIAEREVVLVAMIDLVEKLKNNVRHGEGRQGEKEQAVVVQASVVED